MTLLNNNKGVALIILVIAMTIIAVLTINLISIVADKNKSMIYAYDGFHASLIADSGAAFAIRYISDGLSDTDTTYFTNLQTTQSISSKTFEPYGTFTVTRVFNTNISNDYIEVNSNYKGMALRKIRVNRFRRFLSPITFYPNYNTRPVRNGVQIDIRVLGNHDYNLAISNIELFAPAASPTDVYLKYVYAPAYSSQPIFAYDSTAVKNAYASLDCAVDSSAPCLDNTRGLKLRKGYYTTLGGMSSHTLYRDNPNYYYQFTFDSSAYIGQYSIRFTSAYGSSTWYPELKFTPRLGS